ncbi:MAG TPA: penicillin-binding transpeptidase domain-containing protein [Pyrinomonadaceae bacterium]|nr:penicillin-binding transpeptidase domain-containing protein [Pyrinomonadaceae bacterium]
MTQSLQAPLQTRAARNLFLLLFLLTAIFYAGSAPAKERHPAAKSKTQSARNNKSRAERGRAKTEARAERKRGKSVREERAERASARDRRNARNVDERKGGRALSRRERLLEARRQAAERRRQLEEARRRAEQARLAAIARQRAADQALRDEAAANILKDEVTGEDMEVRRAAVAALGNHAGSVVVMDPKTGRIFTVVNQDWALRKGYKPCSTIKLVTGLAGLSEKVIDPVQTVNISLQKYSLDLTDSLAYSNNGYFQSVGGRVGFDRMVSYARELGLGERTGINHANEYMGRVPAYKTGYAVNHMSSHGDDFEVTPVQLASLVSAIGNGGELLTPHLPRTPQEDVKFKPEVRRRLNVPQENLRRMIPGMIGAVNYGTAKLAYDPVQTIAGKTGTCIGQGSWLGLFASFAPVVDPHLAVVVVTRGSGERGRIAAGIAGKIYRALDARFGNRGGVQMAATPASLTPRSKIDPRAAAALSDEVENEREAADLNLDTPVDATGTATGANAARSNVKSVIMTVPARPTAVTTRPSTNTTNTTTAAPPASSAPTQQPQSGQRPRRVLTNTP